MKRILPLLFVSALASLHTLAQAPDSSRWGSVYISGGAFYAGEQTLYRQDVALITSGSTLLAGGLADHDYDGDAYEEGSGLFEAGIGLYPFRKQGQAGPELRVGFLYGGRSTIEGVFFRSTTTPYDTLVSSGTGQVYYIDSVHRSTYGVRYSAERFGLSTSLTWRTKGRRWSVYGGVGLGGGVLLNARTEVSHSTQDLIEGGYFAQQDGRGRYGTYASETFRNGTGWWCGLWTPVGLDFRIARRGDFWSRMHLYYELRPQLLFQGTPELGTHTGFGLQSVFGARFEL